MYLLSTETTDLLMSDHLLCP